jgi:hypothetical protein
MGEDRDGASLQSQDGGRAEMGREEGGKERGGRGEGEAYQYRLPPPTIAGAEEGDELPTGLRYEAIRHS